MSDTLVIQSHRDPLPYAWLLDCMESVQEWASHNRFDYRFMGDELFEPMEESIRQKTRGQIVIASDIARLIQLQRALEEGYRTVVWCDADFLVFDPESLVLSDSDFALGRESWVQLNAAGRLKTYVRVHNAFLMFRHGNTFLAFYLDTARRLLALNTGRMPPQFVGPKLLSALHNICSCPVQENAGMLSPLVIRSLLGGDQAAIAQMRARSPAPLAAANLCSSSVERGDLENTEMRQIIDRLRLRKSL